MSALVDPTLKVQEDEDPRSGPNQSNPAGLTRGYNPYSSSGLGRKNLKKKDLRALSKWIELRNRVAQKPPEE